MNHAVVIGVVALAGVGWLALFAGRRSDIWTRTWLVAVVLVASSIGGLAFVGELDDAVGPAGASEAAIGAAVGAAWLVATHVGHAVLRRVVPSFVDRVGDLYRLGADDRPRRVIGPVVAMAGAEELAFRGVVQSQWGIGAAVAVYTAVQLVARSWVLALAAFLGGLVWGGLYWWTESLLAAFTAHAVWTASLTLLWRLPGSGSPADAPVRPVRGARA